MLRDRLIEAAKTALPSLSVEVVEGGSPTPQIRQPMDLSASKRDLGWEPRYTLADGFGDYAVELRASLGL